MKREIETLLNDADDVARYLPDQIGSSPDNPRDRLFVKDFPETNERLEILFKGSGMLALKASQVKASFPSDGKMDRFGNMNMTTIEATDSSASILDGKTMRDVMTYFEGTVSRKASQVDISRTVNGIEIASRMIDDTIQEWKRQDENF